MSGFSNGVDIQAINISQSNRQMYFKVILTPQKQSFKVEFKSEQRAVNATEYIFYASIICT
jgi:UDP-N-acetylmuramate-alanine ligase